MVRLDGKSVIVTGGTSGLGKTICEVLGRAGAALVLVDKDELKAHQTSKNLSSEGIKCNFIKADVTKAGEVQAMVDRVMVEYERIDVLVNSAGGISKGFITEISDSEWDEMINTHLKGVFQTCRSVLPYMIERGKGKIINMSSVIGKSGGPWAGTHYATVKAGLIGMTKSLANQLAKYHINVNCVAPAMIITEISSWRTSEQLRAHTEMIALKRTGTTLESAYATLYLASPYADYITGYTMDIGGGMYMD